MTAEPSSTPSPSSIRTLEEVRAHTAAEAKMDYISAARLLGQPIVDAHFSVSSSSGEPCFMLDALVLADGTTILVQGEHDEVYVIDYSKRPELAEEQADALYKEINAAWGVAEEDEDA